MRRNESLFRPFAARHVPIYRGLYLLSWKGSDRCTAVGVHFCEPNQVQPLIAAMATARQTASVLVMMISSFKPAQATDSLTMGFGCTRCPQCPYRGL